MKYNWQQEDWTEFKYELEKINDTLLEFAEETGVISGMLLTMPDDLQMEAVINQMVSEAIKTSEIEGEYFSRQDVISSIRNNLGLNKNPDAVKDKKAHGVGKLMVDVRTNFLEPLSEHMLFSWHETLMASRKNLSIGQWRFHEEPMQVVSGVLGREKVHFEAPPSKQIPEEMSKFIHWFNDTAPRGKREISKAAVRSAIAHLYFESIHPFEDGNGRIGRAIAEKALSQTMGRPVLLSLSKTIESDKKSYYQALEMGQRSNQITEWIYYFVQTLLLAQKHAREVIDFILKKSKFFEQHKNELNSRQLKVINKMFEAGTEGFVGGMNANKYISITSTSKATATRDLQDLAERGVLIAVGGGRSTRYLLNWDINRGE